MNEDVAQDVDAGDRGSATVVGLAACLVLIVVLGLALQLGAALVTRHRAEAAADLAALAAAAHAVSGDQTACAAARRVTDGMAVRLVSCELTGWNAAVTVQAQPPGPLAGFGVAEATARAGPARFRRSTSSSRRAVDVQR